ncbi:MAG: DUF4389 domain-containing protein [Parvibaculum sp.]
MSDGSASANELDHGKDDAGAAPDASGHDRKELLYRFLYMLAFWFLGNIAFSLSILMGAVQLAVILVTGKRNEELRNFSRNLIQYVWQCLAFVTFASEEKPFPLGSFPKL